ncbi:leucine-rich repeat and WD repeat-containing protein 1-like [Acanthaster planci]|uniref:Leucine-rich repeat and WD repeat-containing protein 1-like n=1 Tax=Acanthaster planci TaxID=133434 RepID=A0A8B7YJ78_ACAPL|nr:leucine-rich repeat and WD repeat-containing protein 1-like [Acanthaster planci]
MADSNNVQTELAPTEPILVPQAEEAAPVLVAEAPIQEPTTVTDIEPTTQLTGQPVSQQPSELIPEIPADAVPVLQSECVPRLPVTEAVPAPQDQAPYIKVDSVPPELLPETPADSSAPILQSEPVSQIPVEAVQVAQELAAQVEGAPEMVMAAGDAVLTEATPQDAQPVSEQAPEGESSNTEQVTETPVDQAQSQNAMPTLEPPASVPAYNPQQAPPPISPPKITSYTAVHTTTGIMRYTPGIMSALAGKYSNSSQLVEQLVLNCAGCISLSDIRVLDMSGRKIMNLDPAVFSRMPDLEELDLSFNKIKGFDTQVGLKKLRYLNLKKNSLKSVLTLEQFPNLEELNIEENDLSPPDQYIAVYLLPKLKKLNGKDVDIRDTIQAMEDTLKDRMLKIWKEEFAARNEIPLNKAETRALEMEFVQRLKESIQYGPSSLAEFSNHMLTVLAEKHVASQTAYWRKTVPELIQGSAGQVPAAGNKVSIKRPNKEEASGDISPVKAERGANEANSLAASLEAAVLGKEAAQTDPEKETPMEDDSTPEAPVDSPATPVGTPKKSPAGNKSPAQAAGNKSPAQTAASSSQKTTPIKGPVKVIVVKRPISKDASTTNGEEPSPKKMKEEEVPIKRKRGRPLGSGGKYTKKEKAESAPKPKMAAPAKVTPAKSPTVNSTTKKDKKISSGYEVIHMLRCHSMENDPTDAKTNVWKCAFEPSLEKPGTSKWTVASCGGNTVCITDCSTGKVLKKYQHAKDKEEFYCVAWTTITMEPEEGNSTSTNILAVAGTRGSVKLLHTTQLLCYSEIKGDRRPRPINSLLFHPEHPTWLLCGSEDIIIWDIGIPEGPEYRCKTKKMYHLAAPGRVLGLVALPSSDFILAGCENGCYGWRTDSKQPVGKKGRPHSVEFLLPSKARLAEAIKGDEEEEEGEGDMIDGLALLNDKLVASKVACDGAIHVWNLVDALKKKPNNKEIAVTPQCTMQWCDSDSVYLDIGTWQGCGSLVSGDDEGKIWVYDTSKLPVNPVKSPTTRKPMHLLYWPDEQPNDNASTSSNDHIIINDVAISSDCKYIVSVTNRNVICIWRKL